MIHDVMTLEEAAAYLRVSPITLYRKARQREVPAAKFGKNWRFHRGQLEEWLKNLSERSGKGPVETASFRHLSSLETRSVLNFIDRLKGKFKQEIDQIILFGSRARGDFKEGSDIDLLVVLKREVPPLKKEIMDVVYDINLRDEVLLQALIFSRKEWRDPSFQTFLLAERIRREGIVLYG